MLLSKEELILFMNIANPIPVSFRIRVRLCSLNCYRLLKMFGITGAVAGIFTAVGVFLIGLGTIMFLALRRRKILASRRSRRSLSHSVGGSVPPIAFPIAAEPTRNNNITPHGRPSLPEGFLIAPPIRASGELERGFSMRSLSPREDPGLFGPELEDRYTHEDALSRFLSASESTQQPPLHPFAQP